jgi:glycosyltransferase involved in cell wall biosynthesis
LNVQFIAPSLREASARLRIRQVLPRLGGEGIEATLEEIPRTSRSRWRFIRGLTRADVVVLHRKLFNFLELAFLRKHARRLVFDFDDAVMFRDPFRGSPLSRQRQGRFANTVHKADAVIAGNAYLKDQALEAGARGEVRILPTPVDIDRYRESPSRKGEGTVLGWIGQDSTLPYLEDLLPVLEGLTGENPSLSIRVISDRFPSTDRIRLACSPWTEEGEAELLGGIDIGLMPLRDDPWSQGKCGYKILQYFAAQKPVVASPVGVNVDLVRPGSTGFLAESGEDWVRSITTLIGDPALRRQLGEEGYELLGRGGYTLEAVASHLGAFLRGVA